jgi:hypothetical protein
MCGLLFLIKTVRFQACFFGKTELIRNIKTDLQNNQLTPCRIKAFNQDDPVYIESPYQECGDCRYKKYYNNSGTMIIKLSHNKTIYGLMSISTSIQFIDISDELNLFNEVAHDIAFALHDIEEENQRRIAEAALIGKEELLNRPEHC